MQITHSYKHQRITNNVYIYMFFGLIPKEIGEEKNFDLGFGQPYLKKFTYSYKLLKGEFYN